MNASDDRPDDLGLGSLPSELPPPPELEEKVVARLREGGLIERPPVSRRRWLAAASLAATFALGFLAGDLRRAGGASAASPVPSERYLLLLYEPRAIERREADLVAEYSAWAGQLAQRGQLVAAEKLRASDLRLGALASAPTARDSARGEPTGFFLLDVKDRAEAERIARDCPHLRHGGEVSLRPVERT
jgi:hypothetical protein